MLESATALLLAAHLLLVDLAMAGPCVCVWVEWSATRRGRPEWQETARRLAWLAWAALALGVVLGGLLLGVRYLADDRAYFAAAAAIPRDRLWFALVELLFALLCLGAYAVLWRRMDRRRLWHRLLALAGASNLLIHFPMLFAVISVVSARPQLMTAPLDRAGFRRLLIDGEVLSRVAHVWLAAAAVSGVVVALLAARADRPAAGGACVPLARRGAVLALAATLLQLPVGVWLVLAMRPAARRPFLGDDGVATLLVGASLLLTVFLLQWLWAIACGDATAALVRRATVVMAVVVLLMAGARVRLESQTPPAASGARTAGWLSAASLASPGSSVSIGCLTSFPLTPRGPSADGFRNGYDQ